MLDKIAYLKCSNESFLPSLSFNLNIIKVINLHEIPQLLQGGRHVDHVADQITSKIIDTIKKKVGAKSNVNVKPFQASNRLLYALIMLTDCR